MFLFGIVKLIDVVALCPGDKVYCGGSEKCFSTVPVPSNENCIEKVSVASPVFFIVTVTVTVDPAPAEAGTS